MDNIAVCELFSWLEKYGFSGSKEQFSSKMNTVSDQSNDRKSMRLINMGFTRYPGAKELFKKIIALGKQHFDSVYMNTDNHSNKLVLFSKAKKSALKKMQYVLDFYIRDNCDNTIEITITVKYRLPSLERYRNRQWIYTFSLV